MESVESDVRVPPRTAVAERVEHIPEVDWLKGFAILCVIGIHSKLYDDSLFHQHVVNRAVPMFLLLFAVTSELWWQRTAAMSTEERLRAWYGRRLRRLYVPVWGMASLWWMVAIAFRTDRAMGLGIPELLQTFVGYSPWIGTSWFVTIVLQLVLLYPLLRWAFELLGPVIVLPATAALCWFSGMDMVPIILLGKSLLPRHVPEPGFYYIWIFVPRVFWNVAAGYFVAHWWSGRPPRVATIVATLIAATSIYVVQATHNLPGDAWVGPARRQTILYLYDVPLTVALLGWFRALARLPRLTRFLTWCGLSSWGIYLGHTLVHDLLHSVAHLALETGPDGLRIAYALVLLGCGAGLAALGDRIRRAFSW